MRRTLKDNARLHMLVTQHKLDAEDKAELVKWASNGRVSSSRDLTHAECMKAIKRLDAGNKQTKAAKSHPKVNSPANRMRRKVLHYMHELGYEMPNGKIDMDKVDAWCLKYGMNHKPLQEHSEKELKQLVSQVENMYRKEMQG